MKSKKRFARDKLWLIRMIATSSKLLRQRTTVMIAILQPTLQHVFGRCEIPLSEVSQLASLIRTKFAIVKTQSSGTRRNKCRVEVCLGGAVRLLQRIKLIQRRRCFPSLLRRRPAFFRNTHAFNKINNFLGGRRRHQ